MLYKNLEQHIPHQAIFYIEKWLKDYTVVIKITKDRNTKLGDYRNSINNTHQITINNSLHPDLFFFVLTHEIAHLIAFSMYRNKKIAPHGKEWKAIFSNLLQESLLIYPSESWNIISEFSKNPKASFTASSSLVKYFNKKTFISETEDGIYIEDLSPGDLFIYKEEKYQLEEKKKKRYLCRNISSGRKYLFQPMVLVKTKN